MNDITVYQLSAIAALFIITVCLSYVARKMPSKSERRVDPINEPAIPLAPSTSQTGHAKEAFVEEGENSTQPVEKLQTTATINQEYTATGIDECGIRDAVIIPGAVDEIDGSYLKMVSGNNEEGKLQSQGSQASLIEEQMSSQKDDVLQEQGITVVNPNQTPYGPHPSGYLYQPVSVPKELQQAQTGNLDEHHVKNMENNYNNQSVFNDKVEIDHETNIGKETLEDQILQMDGDKLQDAVVDDELSHELTKEIVPEDTNMAETITDDEMMATLKITTFSNSTDNLNANNDRNESIISAVSPQEAPVNESEAEDRDENVCGKTMPIIGNTDEEVNVSPTPLENHVVDVTADSNIEIRSSSVEVNETQENDQASVHHLTSHLESESEKNEGPTKEEECTTQDTSQSDNVDESLNPFVDTNGGKDGPSEDSGQNSSTHGDNIGTNEADTNQNVEKTEDAERSESLSEDHAQTV